MQDGEEDGPFDREFEAAIGNKFLDNVATTGVTPQTLEQQRRANALAAEHRHAAFVHQR